MWDIEAFSEKYTVMRMTVEDTDIIYRLCAGNPLYYEYCPPFVTRESIGEDLAALPPNTMPCGWRGSWAIRRRSISGGRTDLRS